MSTRWRVWLFGMAFSSVPLCIKLYLEAGGPTALVEPERYAGFFDEVLYVGITACVVTLSELAESMSRRSGLSRARSNAVIGGFLGTVLLLVLLAIQYGIFAALDRTGEMRLDTQWVVGVWLQILLAIAISIHIRLRIWN